MFFWTKGISLSSQLQPVFLCDNSTDPVFFLHITQLDRLGWRWQQSDGQRRSMEYSGKAADALTTVDASLRDSLPMGGLAPDVVRLGCVWNRLPRMFSLASNVIR